MLILSHQTLLAQKETDDREIIPDVPVVFIKQTNGLNKEAFKGLDDIADYLKKYPHITGLRIESLSKNNNQDRLISIGKELRKRGILSKRMVFVYFNQPKYISDTVHFHICTIENRLIKDKPIVPTGGIYFGVE
jgi:hypothetical protein